MIQALPYWYPFSYVIQVHDPDTGYWEDTSPVRFISYAVEWVTRRFLGFTVRQKVVAEYDESIKAARRAVIVEARERQKTAPTRIVEVRRERDDDHHYCRKVVWQEGRWLGE